jgi:hypothetical protein
VARVEALQWFQSAGGRGAPFHQYEAQVAAILDRLQGMTVPSRLAHVHQLVVGAIQTQQKFYAEWQATKEQGRPFQPRLVGGGAGHPLIQSSSQKLHSAYDELMQLYPEASWRNKDAFFDYLCALDFV